MNRPIQVIDRGCTQLIGLQHRAKTLEDVNGFGEIYKHPEGILVVHQDGYTVLIALEEYDEQTAKRSPVWS